MHHLGRRSPVSLGFFIVLAALASSAPTQPSALSHPPDAATRDLSIVPSLRQLPNNSWIAAPEPGPLSPSNLSSLIGVTYPAGIWDISPTLSLDIDIGEWRLSSEKVIGTLEAAEVAVGKKAALALLEEKFIYKTGSRLNTMIFEIGPIPEKERRLNWGDVAEVLEEQRGLPRFFRETKEWHNIDFQVVHSERGLLGFGMIKKWYMLDSERNETGLATG